MVRSIGADHVIDYSKEDFVENGQRYDLILAIGGSRSIFEYRRALEPGGKFVMIGGSTMTLFFQTMLLGPWMSKLDGRKMSLMIVKPNQEDLSLIKKLIEAGDVTPVIDRHYSLPEVPEAIRYLEAGHAQGKVVIDIAA